jgi:hypothetical protein
MWPVYTFRTKLASPLRNSWLLPSGTQPNGNETQSEASVIPDTFTSWIPSNLPGPNIAQKNGFVFTVSGEQALYFKRTYANGSPDDLLILL